VPVPDPQRASTRTGAGRLLIAVYAVLAISASCRALVQLLTKGQEAPVAYSLSLLAGVVYVVATVALARSSARARRWAWVTISVELAGVVGVGLLSLVDAQLFPDDTVWSRFGQGYGFVPLVLPVLGLLWLRRTAPVSSASGGAAH